MLAANDTARGMIESWWRRKYKSTLPLGERTRGDMLEEFFWDLVIERDELREQWKESGDQSIARRLQQLDQVLATGLAQDGKSGDAWFDDWDDGPVVIADDDPVHVGDDGWKDIRSG